MKLPLHLGIHCHQPVENFYHVVDIAVEKSYQPFFELLLKKPAMKVSVHYSGWLFEYIKNYHKDLFGMMQDANRAGQTEFFSGGFYEPVLAAIPSRDRKEQIKKLNGFIEDNFKVSPKGLWLTERVWDSSIIPDCADCGIEYVIVDDYHFIAAGFYESMLHGHFKTEQDGREMLIFPISEKLRYMIPFKPAKDVVGYMGEIAAEGGKSLTIFDDGEKFGLWPETHEWVYEKGWLNDFADAVENSGHSEFALFKDTAETVRPSQIAYLPTVSYFEMGEWSLFAERTNKMAEFVRETEKLHKDDTAKVFVKGGIWKNFLVKYPESNRIHKRTLKLSKDADRLKDARLYDALYKAQCNDVLWHGIFGGLYLPNLRNNAYRFIIEGEKLVEELDGTSYPYIEQSDFDFDGHEEAYVRTPELNFMFVSVDGGQLVSIEDKANCYNFLNTLARRKEAYHEKMLNPAEPDETDETEEASGEEGISTIHNDSHAGNEIYKEYLVYDWHNKNCFVDHFVHRFDAEEFRSVSFGEMGDFANQPADMKATKTKLTFTRRGGVYKYGQKFACAVTKEFSFGKKGLVLKLKIDSELDEEIDYVMEMNLHFNDLENVMINGKTQAEAEGLDCAKIELIEKHTPANVLLEMSRGVKLYTYPVMTVSQSESGADLTRQGICLLMPFRFRKTLELECKLSLAGK
ncbi:alpha-amylase/4-alpha-glucanotransferase domain-containing protein [Seleniivibrio woodruffii]|uniref:alpha-amylase/4-alpha-glucanotransferase domain-containing protein n=1 Tax=Seleniivibrio woodruffii TaxID=1078050 RepID=UPI0026EEE068|nr:alpha-amylase/4-alpha-glucanotransferase domain-containing protein [Seleniivibrio woodruffii]